MSASESTLTAAVESFGPWPIGVDGSRITVVRVTDSSLPGLQAELRFGTVSGGALQLLRFDLSPVVDGEEIRPTDLRAVTVSRWERAARAAAERRTLTEGPQGQHVDPEGEAELLVDRLFPTLADATGGNALRRKRSLLHLARIASEYRLAEATGAKNPAQLLAEQHGVTASTVRSWLHRARREGLAFESTHPNAATASRRK
jgi:hypothetical protein